MSQTPPAADNKSAAIQRIEKLQLVMTEDYVQNQLKTALAENSGPFVASLIDLFTTDQNLQACDPKLVIMQAMKAAVLKLPINKSLGFGYIIAYGGKPEFQIGYRGLIQLALRSGQYEIMNADVVYEGEYKTSNKLTGEFDLSGERTGDTVIGYFAHIKMKNGFSKTLFMTKERVQAHAAKFSKTYAKDYSPWKTDFDSMAIKTVLRNLLGKYGQLSIEVANVLDSDDVADRVNDEINANGNVKGMSFDKVEDATVVPPTNGQQQQQNKEVAPF